MNIIKATKLLGEDSSIAAGARVIVKRSLRMQKLPADNLFIRELAEYFRKQPWECSVAIDRALDSSVRAYERNDDASYQRHASSVELLMSIIDVTLDWPGLYPTYKYIGNVPVGYRCVECYDLSQLWRTIKEMRAFRKRGKK